MSNIFTSRLRSLSIGLALAAAAALPLAAQTAATGNITGTVTDPTGAAVPGATVTIINNDTNVKRTIQTNGVGSYSVPFLIPGNYEVLATGSGFGKIDHQHLTLTVGSTLTVDAALPNGSVTTAVEVTTEPAILDPSITAVNTTIDEHIIDNAPVNSRNWDSFVLLSPNTAPDGGSGLIAFHGISGLYNGNYVDGANNNQMLFAEARGRASGAPYVYSLDSIKEFQSETADYSAEFGQAAGGVVNAVTKSGTDQVHGDLFYYLRYPALNALDPYSKWSALHNGGNQFLLTQPIHQQQQFGGSVGGPIIKDKLFGFFTYDGFRQVGKALYYTGDTITLTPTPEGNSSTIISPTQCPAGITATQCTAAINFIQSLDGSTAIPANRFAKENVFFPRLDYQPTEKDHIFADFNFVDFDRSNGYAANPTYSNSSVSTNGPTSYHERFLIANATHAFSANAVNEARFQWGTDLETAGANASGPSVTLSSLTAYGMPNALPRIAEPDETRWQGTDVFSLNKGHHAFKFGGDINFVHEIMINLYQGGGLYSYSNSAYQNFTAWAGDAFAGQAGDTVANAGHGYSSFVQTIDAINGPTAAAGGDDFWMHMYDVFAEDSWKLGKTVTLNAGVRYDIQLTPNPTHPNTSSPLAAEYNQTIKNVADRIQPRVGLSWQPMNGTVVRLGYGMFSALNQGSTYYAMRVENGVYQINETVGPTGLPVKFPDVLFPLPTVDPSITNALIPAGGAVPVAEYPFPTSTTPVLTSGFHGLSPNFVPPISHEMDLSVEQQLPGRFTLKIGYVGTRAEHLPYFVDANLVGQTPSGLRTYQVTKANGQVQAYTLPFYQKADRINPAISSLNTGFSSANLWYNSLATELHRSFQNGFELEINETWSHSLDDDQVSGAFGTFYGGNPPLDPNNIKAEYGNSDTDLRNRFVATGTYQSHLMPDNKAFKYVINPFKFSGSYIAQTGQPNVAGTSGYPGSSSASTALAGDLGGPTGAVMSSGSGTATTGRPFYIQRNSQFAPGLQDLDMRVSRDIPIFRSIYMQLSAEAFNLANHRIITGVNSTYATYVAPGATSSGYTCPASGAGPTSGGSTFGGCYVPYVSATAGFNTASGTSNLLYGPRQMQFIAKLFF
ncbi:carboxypeptidase regulatory-like domain-containing protein [Granulicella sp. 5B5]|uniref:TonB-dependent receptor n=1 Tax=Granulicella sp. 5B5 TaxID=1617967 RepID=UPI0015F35CDC|nr:TonB-dependent receptor [Granulicella sp. 5B5]QMV18451.1 carboxypeptidase regulatory-like domain-containing protein [Granulicella sp. 5B5]